MLGASYPEARSSKIILGFGDGLLLRVVWLASLRWGGERAESQWLEIVIVQEIDYPLSAEAVGIFLLVFAAVAFILIH